LQQEVIGLVVEAPLADGQRGAGRFDLEPILRKKFWAVKRRTEVLRRVSDKSINLIHWRSLNKKLRMYM
jgi:hypothetical protein